LFQEKKRSWDNSTGGWGGEEKLEAKGEGVGEGKRGRMLWVDKGEKKSEEQVLISPKKGVRKEERGSTKWGEQSPSKPKEWGVKII